MERDLTLCLTSEEAWELFTRCLESPEADTEHSKTALQKLAAALEYAQPLAS
ncbi:MAG: hypothetical protein WAO58_12920 [Fimbriimonadaceae bacterium]